MPVFFCLILYNKYMLTQIENTKGIISFDTSLMDQLIMESLSSFKGEYKLIKKSSEMKSLGVFVSINVHLKFGTSIAKFTNEVFSSISSGITNNFELPLDTIQIVISGMYSKKVAKRNLVIEYNSKSEITSTGD